ncbi:MAG: ABC transporter substrate-binding protein, partial [Actinomycetota bacterium]|nr:ABC transporter substrate-binding protein [Actinomycetota bacterium]
TEDLSGKTIEAAAVWTGGEQESFEAVLAQFEEQTGADVTFTSTGDDVAAVLGTRIEGGEPPDVAILPQPGLLADLADQGALQPIEDVVGTLVDENYAPVWRELGSVDGELYGVWFKAANKSTMWFNTESFEQAGVTPPATWEELQSNAETLLASGVTPFSVGGADGWTLTDWFENVYLRTAGAEQYDKLVAHEIPWTDDSVKTALERLAEIFGEEDWLAGGASGALQTDFPTSVTQVYGDRNEAAVVYEGDFVAGVITGETKAKLGTDADFFDFPSIDGSPPAVVGAGDVAVLLKDSPGGQALLRYLATPEAAAIWAGRGGYTSPNMKVDASAYPDEISGRSAEALTAAETFRFDLSDLQPAAFGGTPGQGLFQLFQDFLRNPDDIDAITEKMEQQATKAFK